MIARERFPVQQDFVPGLRRSIEAGKHEVEIHGQRAHGSDFFRLRADQTRHLLCSLLREQLPLPEGGVFEIAEVADDADGRPGVEIGLHILTGSSRLETEGIPAEIDTWFW